MDLTRRDRKRLRFVARSDRPFSLERHMLDSTADPDQPNLHAAPSRRLSGHLVSTYPVYWSVFAVLRDFLQNFFDAAGPRHFASSVEISRSSGESLIEMAGPGFALDWLVHLGASTKTCAPAGTSAGYFGEGFKIAALCAVRDHGWRVSMGSRDWSARVVFAPQKIDETTVRVLSYDLGMNPAPGRTWLRLLGLSDPQHELLAGAVSESFLFDGNRLLGPQLSTEPGAQVWERSSTPLPRNIACQIHMSDPGLLYLAHQARATLPIPFVVSLPHVRPEQRDRPALYEFQMVDALADAARLMAPAAATRLLDALRRHWGDPLPRGIKVGAWSNVIAALIRRIESDRLAAGKWRMDHPGLLTLLPLERRSVSDRNRRAAARAWARARCTEAVLVQSTFARLGFPTVEQACEAADGFPKPSAPDPVLRHRVEMLRSFVEEHFRALFLEVAAPEVLVMDTRSAGWKGLAVTFPEPQKRWSATGRRIRFRVPSIVMPCQELGLGSPDTALSTYVHERCHIFGGDGAAGFSAALTDAMVCLVRAAPQLLGLQARWAAVGPAAERCSFEHP
jgi:hypothetical protein